MARNRNKQVHNHNPNGNGNNNGNRISETQRANTAERNLDAVLSLVLNSPVLNAVFSRKEWLQRSDGTDPRRSIYDECGYPKTISCYDYQNLYDREGIACRVVNVWPMECWQVSPEIYEVEETDKITPFEQAIEELGKSLNPERSWLEGKQGNALWQLLQRIDVLSGIGQYGVIVLTIDDGKKLSEPAEMIGTVNGKVLPVKVGGGLYGYASVAKETTGTAEDTGSVEGDAQEEQLHSDEGTVSEGASEDRQDTEGVEQEPPPVTTKRRLICAECFPESLAQITAYDQEPTSPRYGKPVKYLITLNDPRNQSTGSSSTPISSTVEVHWTRVVHIADNVESNKSFGKPRMQQVFNRLLDIQKIQASDGEGFWKSVIANIYFETHPQLGGDVQVDLTALKDRMELMQNGLERWAFLRGMSAKTLPPAMLDPTTHINSKLEEICIRLGVPVRIFKGSERGELASTQDDDAWNDRVKNRQNNHVTPGVIAPLIDRLIALYCLPEPEQYAVYWPDITSENKAQKAQVITSLTQAIATYLQSDAQTLVPPLEYFTKVWEMDEEEVTAMLEAAMNDTQDLNPLDTDTDTGMEGTDTGLGTDTSSIMPDDELTSLLEEPNTETEGVSSDATATS